MSNQNQKTKEEKQSEQRELLLDRLSLFYDKFFLYCLKDQPEAARFILSILDQNPALDLHQVQMQEPYIGARGREVALDLSAWSGDQQTHYDLEIQQNRRGLNPARCRVYASLIDSSTLESGTGYDRIFRSKIFFVCSFDPFGKGMPFYRKKTTMEPGGNPYEDGLDVVFFNGRYRGEDDLGWLMHDLACTDPEQMHFKELSDLVQSKKQYIIRREGKEMPEELKEFLDQMIREDYKEQLEADTAAINAEKNEAIARAEKAEEKAKEAQEEAEKAKEKAEEFEKEIERLKKLLK